MDLETPEAGTAKAVGSAMALDALRFHWGDAYEIDHDDELGWWAQRRDGLGGRLTGMGPEDLFNEICADYTLNPVPRQHDPSPVTDPDGPDCGDPA